MCCYSECHYVELSVVMLSIVMLNSVVLGTIFVQMGLNEADTTKSSSILIYYQSEQGLYTQRGWHDAVVIKSD
jgi:hypothetical protein